MRALLVEDDSSFAVNTKNFIRQNGGVVDHAETGEEALDLIKVYEYDIVILDFMLPDMNGIDVIRRVRMGKNAVPIILMSANFIRSNKIDALSYGADDVVTKPFDSYEFKERIIAIMRRSRGIFQSEINIGNIIIHISTKHITIDNRDLHLTNKEYAILELLVLRRGHIVSKEVFLDHLYNCDNEPDAKIIDVFICKLRKKLADCGAQVAIKTVWGQGYCLTAS